MSVAAVTWALSQWLDPAPKMVLVAIADRVNHKAGDGFGFPSLEDIAEISCQHRRTVQRHIASLENLGLLIKEHRRADGGRQTTNLYKINMDVVITRDGEAEAAESGSQVDKLPPSSGGQIATLGGGTGATLGGGTCATPTINGKNEQEDEHLPPKAPQGARETRANEDDEEGFERFVEAWRGADEKQRFDKIGGARAAWKRLTADERRIAGDLDTIRAVVAGQRRSGRQKLMGPATYLNEKHWTQVPKVEAGGVLPVPMDAFKRHWWCRFYEFARYGSRHPNAAKAKFMAKMAEEKGIGVSVPLGELQRWEAASAGYVYVLVASPDFVAWREWFADRGFRLPRPSKVDRIWMPSARPPDEATVGQSQETQREGGR